MGQLATGKGSARDSPRLESLRLARPRLFLSLLPARLEGLYGIRWIGNLSFGGFLLLHVAQ